MYQLINQNYEPVLQEIGRNDDVFRYVRLLTELRTRGTDAVATAAYQALYRSYWRMNMARLDAAFYARYFELLAQCHACGRAKVKDIALELARVSGQSLQFSFATKLVHMVDPRQPVYDCFIAGFFFHAARPGPLEERLRELLAFQEFLCREYARVLRERLLDRAMQKFRVRFPDKEICDERVVDWLLWAWVSLLRQGAQLRGELLYH